MRTSFDSQIHAMIEKSRCQPEPDPAPNRMRVGILLIQERIMLTEPNPSGDRIMSQVPLDIVLLLVYCKAR